MDRDNAVRKIREAKIQEGGKFVWAKPDLPLQVRVPQGLLFGAKRLMVEWEFPKNSLWADPDNLTLQYGDEKVLEVSVLDDNLHLQYGPEWEEYLKEDEQWQNLVKIHTDKLRKGKGGKGGKKGKSKTSKGGGLGHHA